MKVKFKCPCCETVLRGVDMMEHATLIVKRTCKCGKRWQVKVTPLRSKDGVHIHAADFTPI